MGGFNNGHAPSVQPGAMSRCRGHHSPGRGAAALLLCLALAAAPTATLGQGLVTKGPATMGAAASFSALKSIYGRSKAWKASFAAAPRTACSASSAASLCSSGGGVGEHDRLAQLVVATSPRSWNSSHVVVGNKVLDLIGAAGDQRPCSSCTGFTVAAAARAAMAAELARDASSIEPFSVQDILYCSPGAPLSCGAGWMLSEALKQLVQRRIAPESCMPYQPPGTTALNAAAGPSRRLDCVGCPSGAGGAALSERHHALARLGSFAYEGLSDEWTVARHIRRFGGVVSRFDIMSDFKQFFSDPGNARAVYSPKPGAKMVEAHSVVIMGYNLEESWWLCLNSWGPHWADNGMFRVAFGACSIATPPDLYGISWRVEGKSQAPRLPASIKMKGCLEYKARRGDYLSGVAAAFSVPLERLLLDNVGAIGDLDGPIEGKTLALCGIKSPAQLAGERMREAIKKKTLGMSFGGGGYLMIYNLGVLDVFVRSNLVDRYTKMSGAGQNTQCTLCMNKTVDYMLLYINKLRRLCDAQNACWGTLEDVARKMMKGNPGIGPLAPKWCYGVCFVGMATAAKPDQPASYFDVFDWRSVDDMKEGIMATSFCPVVSAPRASAEFRGQEVTTGWLATPSMINSCPPGVKFCVRVSPFAAPQVEVPFDLSIALGGISRLSKPKGLNRPTAATLFGPGGAAAAAAALAGPGPSGAELMAAAEKALEYGVEVAPNIYTPLKIKDPSWWQGMGGIPPDDGMAEFLVQLGRRDAKLFLRAMGVPAATAGAGAGSGAGPAGLYTKSSGGSNATGGSGSVPG